MASHPQEYTHDELVLTQQDLIRVEQAKRNGEARKVVLSAIQQPNGVHKLFSTRSKTPLASKQDATFEKHSAQADGSPGA